MILFSILIEPKNLAPEPMYLSPNIGVYLPLAPMFILACDRQFLSVLCDRLTVKVP